MTTASVANIGGDPRELLNDRDGEYQSLVRPLGRSEVFRPLGISGPTTAAPRFNGLGLGQSSFHLAEAGLLGVCLTSDTLDDMALHSFPASESAMQSVAA